jgi:heme-degrading monooxygenase HmoA
VTVFASRTPSKVYTVYSWTTKEGHDKDFVAAWRELARLVVNQAGSTKSTRLFRDVMDRRHFMSVDSWNSEKALRGLQQEPEFGHKLAELRKLLDNFSSWSLRLEAEEKA